MYDPYGSINFDLEMEADVRNPARREARFREADDLFTRHDWPRSLERKANKAIIHLRGLRHCPGDKATARALADHCGNTKYDCKWTDSLPFRYTQRLALAHLSPSLKPEPI